MISNLLSGKRKIDVQNKLFSMGFVDYILNPLFDMLFEDIQNQNNQSIDDVKKNINIYIIFIF